MAINGRTSPSPNFPTSFLLMSPVCSKQRLPFSPISSIANDWEKFSLPANGHADGVDSLRFRAASYILRSYFARFFEKIKFDGAAGADSKICEKAAPPKRSPINFGSSPSRARRRGPEFTGATEGFETTENSLRRRGFLWCQIWLPRFAGGRESAKRSKFTCINKLFPARFRFAGGRESARHSSQVLIFCGRCWKRESREICVAS